MHNDGIYQHYNHDMLKYHKLFCTFVDKYQRKLLKWPIMMESINKDWIAMSDNTIIATIGEFVKQKRLQEDKTQSQLAKDAGLNRSTIVQIEKGESVTLTSLIQILRVLNLLHLMDIFILEDRISPMEYVKMQEKKRLRAGKKSTEHEFNDETGW